MEIILVLGNGITLVLLNVVLCKCFSDVKKSIFSKFDTNTITPCWFFIPCIFETDIPTSITSIGGLDNVVF